MNESKFEYNCEYCTYGTNAQEEIGVHYIKAHNEIHPSEIILNEWQVEYLQSHQDMSDEERYTIIRQWKINEVEALV